MEIWTACMHETVGVYVSIHSAIKKMAFKIILLNKTPKAN